MPTDKQIEAAAYAFLNANPWLGSYDLAKLMLTAAEQAQEAQPVVSELVKALSRLAGNRHSDGTSSLVSCDDRTIIINGCHDLMLALRRTSPTIPEGWQTLETAPKDGQTIVAMRDEEGLRAATLIFWDSEDGWCGSTANNELMRVKHSPTHWMPLPAAPSPSALETRKESR